MEPNGRTVAWRAAFVALAALAVPASAARAQEAPESDPEPDRWKAVADLAFTGSSGNESLVVLTSGMRISHLLTELFELEIGAQVRYGRSEGREIARNTRGDIKFDLYPQARWTPFVYTTAERDPFRRIELRAAGGGGVKFTAVRSDRSRLSLSVAALYSYEDYGFSLDSAIEQLEQNARLSWRVLGRRTLTDGVRVEHTAYYQPIWNRAGDYQLEADTRLSVRMTDRIALMLAHAFERNSTPPEDVRKDDHVVRAGLSIEF